MVDSNLNLPQEPASIQNGRNQAGMTDPTYNARMLVEANVAPLKELFLAEIRHADEMLKLHMQYQKELREAEAKRIDAIRAVDVAAVATANDRAVAQAQVLANQVAQSAETLRTLVASTATSVAQSLQQVSAQLIDRIALLEKAQYTNVGKSSQEEAIPGRIETLERKQSESTGRAGISTPLLLAIAALAGGIITILIKFLLTGAP